MTEESIKEAINECKRFLDRARAYNNVNTDRYSPSKERAAMRRASLDASRALAAMRKG